MRLNLFLQKKIIILSIIFFCTSLEAAVTQVKSNIKFGPYIISPPKGYWYYPKKFTQGVHKNTDFFLLTFCPNKNYFLTPPIPMFINFSVTKKTFKNYSEYYKNSRKYGAYYSNLPEHINSHLEVPEWSCKMLNHGYKGVECIAINEYLITVALIGKNIDEIEKNIPTLKSMLLSLKRAR